MGNGSRHNPLLDDFKRALEVNEEFSLDEQFKSCESFIRNLEEQADINESLKYSDMSESSVLRNLEGSFNHYPKAMAKEMFVGKIVSGINSTDDFIECLQLLQKKFPSSSRISSLINKMTKNNQHLEMLKRKVENY